MLRRNSLFPIKIYGVFFKSVPKFSLLICVVYHIIYSTQTLSASEPSQFNLFNGSVIVDLEFISSNKFRANFRYLGATSVSRDISVTFTISLLSNYRTSASNMRNYTSTLVWDTGFHKKLSSHQMLVPEMKKTYCDASEIYIDISWPGYITETMFFTLANTSFRMLSTFSVETLNGANEVKYY